jgi:leucyl aminopeptidase
MGLAATQDHWKKLLPPSFEWLQGVQISGIQALNTIPEGAHLAVFVKPDTTDKERFVIDAPGLPEGTRAKLMQAASLLGWRTGAGSIHLQVDSSNFILVSISQIQSSQRQICRQAGLDSAKFIKDYKVSHLVIMGTSQGQVLDICEGFINGLYTQFGFKGQRKADQKWPTQLTLVGADAQLNGIRDLVEFSKAQIITRFLQDAPPNYLTPRKFAEIASDIAKENGLKHKILGREQMRQLGMGMFLCVAEGSVEEPQLICIEVPGIDQTKTVSLVGKGLTFDAGGISIKGAAGMEEMKYDMSGGAAVLGAAQYFSVMKPPVNVVCVIGATENLPSGSAIKPSDVVRAFNGKTVEIQNTDAEGRLVLGDCLSYAIQEYKPILIADIATLTGAVLMALGCVGGAVFGSDKEAAAKALRAAELSGEPFWQLPLWPELEKEVKSDTADLKNIAKPSVKAGTIMGAWFLKEFVGTTPWVHFDIAGTAWNCQALGYPTSGSGAYGLRTLVQLCKLFG